MNPKEYRQEFYSRNFWKDDFDVSDKYLSFMRIIREYSPKRFLDLGCGNGYFANAVKGELGCEVSGIEISPEGAKEARSKGVDSFALDIDEGDLPFPDDYFEFIYSGEVIEHVHFPDHFLKEVKRVLAPEGGFLLTTPNLGAWYNRFSLLFGYQPIFNDVSLEYSCGHLWPMDTMAHTRLFTLRALRALMESHGFQFIKAQGIPINYKCGFGQAHPILARIANNVFRHPGWNSGLVLLAEKPDQPGEH